MLPTLALLVFFSAITVFFSREFGALFKKLFAITGVPLFLPLIMASFLVVLYEPWIFIALIAIKQSLNGIIEQACGLVSYPAEANRLFTIIVLASLTLLPVEALNRWSVRKTWQPFQYAFITSIVIWLFLAILLTI